MPALTDAEIRTAIRRCEAAGKPITLSDGDGKGTGRLRLTIRPMPTRTMAEWYAVQYRDGRRTQAKIGAYPAVSLADARTRFGQDYSRPIAIRQNIKLAAAARPGTVGDLFTAYMVHLEAAGKPSVVEVRKSLDKAAAIIGANRPAREVTPGEITAVLAPIYARGSVSMADHVRGYLRAAFGWGLRADNDYRQPGRQRRFMLERNPAADIPTEPKKVGERWLSSSEYRAVHDWLAAPDTPVTPHYTVAIRLLMLTGQRVREITTLRAGQWNSAERTLDWPKTKNGRPHCVPVCQLAADLLDSLKPSADGWLFPSASDPAKPVTEESLYCTLWRTRSRKVLPAFALRDLRRTWKTLAGEAGLTKTERDLLQNHARQDVSSRHYDRYEYMTEKRQAVEKWGQWVGKLLKN